MNRTSQPRLTRLFAAMLLFMVAFAVSGIPSTALAVAPENIISYQGRLLNSNGVPVSNGSLDMQFDLYSDSAGITCLWSNDDSNCASDDDISITLTDGLFSVNLGATGDGFAAIPDSVFADNDEVYLGVTVEGESLLPLKRVVAAPYALNAQTLDGIDSDEFCQADGTNCLSDAGLWEVSAFGTYEDDDDVIIGTNVGETITDAGFSLSGNDLFVAGDAGVEGTLYSDLSVSVEGSVLDIDSLGFVASGTISSGGVANLVLSPGGGIVDIDGDIIRGSGALELKSSGVGSLALNTEGGDIVIGDNPGTTLMRFGGNGIKYVNVGSTAGDGYTAVTSGTGGISLTSMDDIVLDAADDLTLTVDSGVVSFGQDTTIGDGVNNIVLNSDGNVFIDDSNLTGTGALNISSGVGTGLALNPNGAGTSVSLGDIDLGIDIQIGNGSGGNTISMGTDNTVADTIAIGSALDTLTISSAEFGVSGTTGSVTINDGGNAGSLSVEGTVLDIDSLTFGAPDATISDSSTSLTVVTSGYLTVSNTTNMGFDTAVNISAPAMALNVSSGGTLTLGTQDAAIIGLALGTSSDVVNIATDNTAPDTINIGSATDTLTISSAEFGVSGTTGSVTINDGGNAGSLSVEGTVLDIDSLDFVGVGAISTGGGAWSVTSAGAATFASLTLNGTLDMANNLILNVGNAGTDFTAGGGLTLAGTFVENGSATFNADADFVVDGTENITIGNSVGTGTNSVDLLSISIVNTDAAANAQRGLVVSNAAGSSAATEALVALDNADALAVSAAVSITGSGGAITTAVDASDPNIVTALSVGDNIITGAAGVINFTNFDVLSSGEVQVAAATGIDTNAAGTLDIGRTNATTLSMCNSAACDSIQIGTNADADSIAIGDVNDTLAFMSGAGDTTFTLSDDFIISGSAGSELDLTVANATSINGIFNLTTSTAQTGGFEAADINLTMNDGTAASDNISGLGVSLTGNDADGDMFGVVVVGNATTNAAAGTYRAAFRVINAENTIGAMTDAFIVESISGTDGDITTGINVSSSTITNAISVGANTILGTNAAIDFAEFDVSAATGSVTIDDGGNTGALLVENTRLDMDELSFVTNGTISSSIGNQLIIDASLNTASTILLGVNDALQVRAADSTNNTFVDSPALIVRGTYDSDPTAGVVSSNQDSQFVTNVTAGGASPASQLEVTVGAGGAPDLTLTDLGVLSVPGSVLIGDLTGTDSFTFTTAITGADAFTLNADSMLANDIMQVSADGLTTGRGLFIERADGGGSFSGPGLLAVQMLDTDSTGKVVAIGNSGTGSALFVEQKANTGTTVNATTGGGLHIENTGNANYGLTVYSNHSASASPLSYFWADNSGFDSDIIMSQMDATAAADNTTQNQAGLRVLMLDVGNPDNNSVNNGGIVIDTNEEDVANGDNLQQEMFQVRMDADNDNTGTNTVFAVDMDGDFGYDGTAYTTAVDVAEIYPTTQTLVAGELVMADPLSAEHVVRTVSAYQSSILGIVSTRPGVLLGSGGADGTYSGSPIALTGRVPTFVSDENGVISIGDALTSSSVAGVAMKATEPGMIVGYALEDYAGAGQGTIGVFVSPGFYAGNVIGNDGSTTVIDDDVTLTGSLALRGSSGSGITAAMTVVTDVTDATDYRLSIQNTAGAQVAYVSDEGDLALAGRLYPSDHGVIQTSKYIYYDGSAGMGGDFMRTNASGWATGSYDFAEMFPSDDELEAGDLVVFGADNESVARSTTAGSSQLAGIVSTRPGFLAGDNDAGSYPIALAGRVPTKVNLENGPIAVGDPLTSSSTDGYAMQAEDAGVIVGYALEPYDGSSGSDDKIVAFVSVGYWNGNPTPSLPGTNNQASTIVVTQNASNLTALNMNGNIYMSGNDIVGINRIAGISDTWSISADGTVLTEGLVQTAIESYQGDLIRTTAVTSPDVQITLTGTATLENGEAVVSFEDVNSSFNDVISTTAPIRVIVTPNGPVSLYVGEKNAHGFGVRQMDGSATGVTFDWMVTAYRKDFEPEELIQTDEEPVEAAIEEEVPAETEPAAEPDVTDEETTTASDETATDDPAPPASPDSSQGDSTESTSVDTEPAPPVLPADEVL